MYTYNAYIEFDVQGSHLGGHCASQFGSLFGSSCANCTLDTCSPASLARLEELIAMMYT